jgi:hypothetical protein
LAIGLGADLATGLAAAFGATAAVFFGGVRGTEGAFLVTGTIFLTAFAGALAAFAGAAFAADFTGGLAGAFAATLGAGLADFLATTLGAAGAAFLGVALDAVF